jgi:inosine/xanthosine triphosphatase
VSTSAVLRVCVGSENRAKLEAVRLGLEPFFPGAQISGIAVGSGVSEQPVGLSEIIAGARTRARGAFDRAAGRCDLAAGIEDGLVPLSEAASAYINLGCCVLYDGVSESLGFTPGFEYPASCVEAAVGGGAGGSGPLADARKPIGALFDAAFAAVAERQGGFDPGPGSGNIGRLTRGVLTRAQYGAQAVICALVRRLHRDLYTPEKVGGR